MLRRANSGVKVSLWDSMLVHMCLFRVHSLYSSRKGIITFSGRASAAPMTFLIGTGTRVVDARAAPFCE